MNPRTGVAIPVSCSPALARRDEILDQWWDRIAVCVVCLEIVRARHTRDDQTYSLPDFLSPCVGVRKSFSYCPSAHPYQLSFASKFECRIYEYTGSSHFLKFLGYSTLLFGTFRFIRIQMLSGCMESEAVEIHSV